MRLFDEINDLSESDILSIEDYFDEMELSDEEKEQRKEFSESMVDTMLFIFALFSVMRQYDYINKSYIIGQLQSRYSEVVLQYMDIDKAVTITFSGFRKKLLIPR